MAGRDWTQEPFQIVAPPGAGPNDPRIEIGQVMPPGLVAYYAAQGKTVVQGIIYFRRANNYEFDVLLDDGVNAVRAAGGFDGANYSESWSMTPGGTVGQFNVGGVFGGTLRLFLTATSSQFIIYSGGNGGIEQGRGMVGYAVSTANSAAVGADTVVLTAVETTFGAANITYQNGRAYSFEVGARYTASVGNTGVLRFRRTNAAGTIILETSNEMLITAQGRLYRGYAINNSGADISVATVFTLGATAGTITQNGAATIPRFIKIEDVGSATQWAGYPQIPAA